ncbi:aldo/keto reductase [Elioraea thermophila]|uniref:aldo/keto reductase n=1 Tax=Elioraea thermophila TaxID=2185104 RepID=UPI000DF3A449|nr:aldo/keto reductase [Elioraea thermophila]
MRTVRLPDGVSVPALGQGTWRMGEERRERAREVAALRLGIELGLTLIDTAEMYGEGGAEEVVGEAIRDCRARVFVVSKVYPHNAGKGELRRACERSLARLGIDRLDLYLLHWRGGTRLPEVVEGFEALREDGLIARWGVSNFDADDMAELWDIPRGSACATNQVLYNPQQRGIEFDLLPWCAARGLPVMAYSPVGQGGKLLRHPALRTVAERHGASPAQVALAWAIRHPSVIAIPKAVEPDHVRENAAALSLALTEEDHATLDRAFPPPTRKRPLSVI